MTSSKRVMTSDQTSAENVTVAPSMKFSGAAYAGEPAGGAPARGPARGSARGQRPEARGQELTVRKTDNSRKKRLVDFFRYRGLPI